jgi:hypothetical protein
VVFFPTYFHDPCLELFKGQHMTALHATLGTVHRLVLACGTCALASGVTCEHPCIMFIYDFGREKYLNYC